MVFLKFCNWPEMNEDVLYQIIILGVHVRVPSKAASSGTSARAGEGAPRFARPVGSRYSCRLCSREPAAQDRGRRDRRPAVASLSDDQHTPVQSLSLVHPRALAAHSASAPHTRAQPGLPHAEPRGTTPGGLSNSNSARKTTKTCSKIRHGTGPGAAAPRAPADGREGAASEL